MTGLDDEVEILTRVMPLVDERLRAAVEAGGQAFEVLPIVLDAATATVVRMLGRDAIPLEAASVAEVDRGVRVFLQGAIESRARDLIRREQRAARRKSRRRDG